MTGDAVISECGQYRYFLQRPSEIANPDTGPAVFLMLNPSTADATVDDPTIRRCRSFAKRWGCAGIIVVNLFAYRSTDPKGLRSAIDPIGPENDEHLMNVALRGDIVCAWGGNAPENRVKEVVALLKKFKRCRLLCLGTTTTGAPRHPLYVLGDQPLVEWPGGEQHDCRH